MIARAWCVWLCLLCPALLLGDVVDDLDSPDFTVRRAAMETLLIDDALDAREVLDWMQQRALSLEQRHRLKGVALHHLLREAATKILGDDRRAPRIALGFGHQPSAYQTLQGEARGAVLVVRTLPGLPAHGRLRVGDRIIRAAGQGLPLDFEPVNFATIIASLPAGQPVELTIVREGETLTLTLPVSRLDVLSSLYDESSLLKDPYRTLWREFEAELE